MIQDPRDPLPFWIEGDVIRPKDLMVYGLKAQLLCTEIYAQLLDTSTNIYVWVNKMMSRVYIYWL